MPVKCQECDETAKWYREAADLSPDPVGFCHDHIEAWRGGFSRIWLVKDHPPCVECEEGGRFMASTVCEILDDEGDVCASASYGDPRWFCSDECHAKWSFNNGAEMPV